jgi:molecular chaperone GrpE (heat shock protein)
MVRTKKFIKPSKKPCVEEVNADNEILITNDLSNDYVKLADLEEKLKNIVTLIENKEKEYELSREQRAKERQSLKEQRAKELEEKFINHKSQVTDYINHALKQQYKQTLNNRLDSLYKSKLNY